MPSGFRAVAIVLMHGYRQTAHEEAVAEIAREVGFTQVSVSHEASPLMKIVGRGDTTVVDAYLSPILRAYVDRVAAETGRTRLMFMQSSGGLVDAHRFAGKDAILSGPAGGIVGAVKTAAVAGFERIIGFDMGGTSTDVAHYAGAYERAFETEVAGVRMRAPMMKIHTVAAGGGSIIAFDGGRFRVGPESAGANPGPACYRRGGPLAVTDANLMVGKLVPELFPPVFGPRADQPLDAAVVHERFAQLAAEVEAATGVRRTPQELAQGCLAIANDNMANAIKKITIQRGIDVSTYTLVCFGGAGAQHACQVADLLGIGRVMIHPYASVLSAYGMGLAEIRTLRQRAVDKDLAEGLSVTSLTAVAAELGRGRPRGAAGPARARGPHHDRGPRPSPLCRDRRPARGGAGRARCDAGRLRGRAQEPLRLHRRRPRPRGRGGHGRGHRRHGGGAGAGARLWCQRATPLEPVGHTPVFTNRAPHQPPEEVRGRDLPPRGAAARATGSPARRWSAARPPRSWSSPAGRSR